MLRINDVVMFEEVRYRILDVTDFRYVWIDIDANNAFPESIKVSVVKKATLAETLSISEDPFSHLATRLPPQGSTAQKIRDKRLTVIESLINQPGIHHRNGRGTLIQQVVEKHGTAKKTVYAYLRLYW